MQSQDEPTVAAVRERALGEAPVPAEAFDPQIERTSRLAGPTSEHGAATETIKVSTRSRPSAVAGAIAGILRQRAQVDVQSIGAGATNQAIKAVAIACVYLRDDGIAACCVPSFMQVQIDGEERTAVRLVVQRRPPGDGAEAQRQPTALP